MAIFIVISNLTDRGAETIAEKPERIKAVNEELAKVGAKIKEQYIVFGDMDFINIVEVEDAEKFLKAIIELNSRGTVRTRSYLALPVDKAINAIKSAPSIGHPQEKK
ncbi:GYD domain-containing protein [Metallosphaera hakonensis]|uniref:GYD family protein n=2 Tax=Metallosphaera hakonensis TaxID=79601 RepID=A0A2U9IUX1_9CREN|nr:GYD domain-containing protein [Metallosphaera hakonensis]AWR99804.1 GYD domain-containing protein [Metallosphaera hakonensis JCM 8857 = DSM 7519]